MSMIQEALIAELKERIEQTQQYTKEIQTAKTKTKIQYLKEKRKKNNIDVSRLLIALDRIEKEQ